MESHSPKIGERQRVAEPKTIVNFQQPQTFNPSQQGFVRNGLYYPIYPIYEIEFDENSLANITNESLNLQNLANSRMR